MTLKELIANIRLISVIEDTNVTDSEISTIINQGLHEVSVAFPWPWLEKKEDLSMTEDVPWIDIPDNFDYAITLVDDDNDVALPFVPVKEFFEETGNNTGNEGTNPEFFTIFDGKIYLSPTPSADDNDRLSLYYYGSVSELSLNNDEPPFHDAYHWMLVEYALWKLYNREEYFAQSERAFITYARYLNDMMSWYGSPIKHAPFAWGDGSGRVRQRRDRNIPLLNDY